MFSNSENHAVHEIMRKNIVLLCRPQKTMWCTRIVYWLPKDTNKHLDYVILNCFITASMVARTCLSVMLYEHCLICCVIICLNVSLNRTEFYVICHKVVFFFFLRLVDHASRYNRVMKNQLAAKLFFFLLGTTTLVESWPSQQLLSF